METATLTRRRPGTRFGARLRAAPAAAWARAAFALLCLGTFAGFLLYPTYPNYDSYYSLLWGRELLAGEPLSFRAYRAPTEHPLAIVVGALLSLLGDVADRVWIGATFAAFLALVAGVYRLGTVAFTPLVGAIAAVLLVTRFDFPFLAARGYIDVPYLALVIWAAALEASRPRRGVPVLGLLAAAGTLRPEAWVLAGLYFLWLFPRASGRRRAGYAVLAAAGPLVWIGVDWAATGDPLFSLTYTSESAEDLGRQRTLAEIPAALPDFFAKLVKLPVLVLAVLGLAVGAALAPRRAAMPLVLLVSGVGTFFMIGVAGLSVIDRYLIVAALALLVFAAVALGGWTMLEPGTRARRWWAGAAVACLLLGAVFTATRVDLERLEAELAFRGDAHAALVDVLQAPAVAGGLRCGPLTLPNHKLVPDSRWVLDLPADRVLSRTERRGRRARRGVAILALGRAALFKQALTNPYDGALVQVPPAGFQRRVVSEHYAAYVAC